MEANKRLVQLLKKLPEKDYKKLKNSTIKIMLLTVDLGPECLLIRVGDLVRAIKQIEG